MMELENRIRIINEEWTDIYYLLHYIDKENLTHQAIRLLQYIDKNKETTIGDLAKHINTSSNTASEHIKRLIKKGLVTKQRSEVDERKVIVKITEEGKHTLHRHTNLDEAKLKKVLGSLTDSELEIIQKGFLILSEGAKNVYRSKGFYFSYNNWSSDRNSKKISNLWRNYCGITHSQLIKFNLDLHTR